MFKRKILRKTYGSGLIFIMVMIICFCYNTAGQTITPILNITPPYTSALTDYSQIPFKVSVILINNSLVGGNVNAYIHIDITNDQRNIHIFTSANYKPARELIIIPNVPLTLTPSQISDFMDINKLFFTGITRSEVMKNGLPEGNYVFCIKVYDYASNRPISNDIAGCKNINIVTPEPPVVLSPVCGDSLHVFVPQQVIFTWAPPIGVPVTSIQYTLRMTQVQPDGTDPHQSMASATYPYFYELKGISTNTLIYGPAQPSLIKGKTYAFTVTAIDPQGKLFFKNGGASEVCYFKYGSTDTSIASQTKPTYYDTAGKIATSVSGKLFYNYNQNPNQTFILKNTIIKLEINYLKKSRVNGKYTYVKPSGNLTNFQLFSLLKQNSKAIYAQMNPFLSQQFAKSYNGNNLFYKNGISNNIENEFENEYVTVTNNNGEFSFIINLDPKDTSSWIPNPQQPDELLYKTYTLMIMNPYYNNSPVTFELKPGDVKELGSVIAPVITYNLNVNVQQMYQSVTGKILNNMAVFVLRKNKSKDLPENEGDLGKSYPEFFGYKVIAKARTSAIPANNSGNVQENSVTFTNLVGNLISGDEYILYAAKAGPTPQSDFSSFSSYASSNNSDLVQYAYQPDKNSNVVTQNKKTLYCISQNPPTSTVTGTLEYIYPGDNTSAPKPLKNIKISLVVQYKYKGSWGNSTNDSFILSDKHILNSDLPLGFQMPSDNGQVLDTKYTDAAGNFSFNFYNIDSVKVVDNQFLGRSSCEVCAKYLGKLERVYRVLVESPYYCSPDDDISVQPWNNYNAGTLTSYVMNYDLKLKVMLDSSNLKVKQTILCNTDGSIPGVKVSLYRWHYDPDLPTDEGQNLSVTENVWSQYLKLVSQGINGSDGTITFSNLIRSSFDGDYYIIRTATSNTSGSATFSSIDAVYPSTDDSKRSNEAIINVFPPIYVYNSEYKTNSNQFYFYESNKYNYTVTMTPNAPRIAGRVISIAAPNGVKSVIIKLQQTSSINNNQQNIYTWTDSSGYFSFDKNYLLVEYQDPNDPKSNVIGPERDLFFSCTGYKDFSIDLGIMKMGAQYYDQNINMNPLGQGLYGCVRDSVPNVNNSDLKGDPIAAKVRIGNGAWVNTYDCYPYECSWDQQKFVVNAPTGNNQQLTIVPFDPAYPPRTFKVNVTSGNNWLGYFELSKMKHKIQIRVIRKTANGQYSNKPVPVASVPVNILDMTKTTDNNGYVYFEFTNNSITNFTANVSPTPAVNFVPASFGFANAESTDIKTITISVEDAISVKGIVTSAESGHPLRGAKVFVNQGNNSTEYYALTDGGGNYTLYGVPKDPPNQVLMAVYTDPGNPPKTYIGKTHNVNSSSGNLNNINFALQSYDQIDLSHLLGFEIEVDSLQDLGNGLVQISGAFINVPDNPNFKLLDPKMRIPFSNMKVVKSNTKNSANVPIGEPDYMPFGLDMQIIPIKIFGFYNGELRPGPNNALPWFEKDNKTGKGMFTGQVRIVDNSFNFPSSYMTFTNQDFYLGNYGQPSVNNKMKLVAFRPSSENFTAMRFCLARYDASPINFTLLGFNGAAFTGPGSNESYISGDTVNLFLQLNANLPFNPPIPLTINAGRVQLFHDHIAPIDNFNNIIFNLEKWVVKGLGWTLSTGSGGIVIKTGSIKTGTIDVPFENMTITPNDLICTKYNVNNLSLAGVTSLNIDPSIPDNNKIFTYDPEVGQDLKGHYKLLIIANGNNPVATFGGANVMEGMNGNDVFRIAVINLISNGEQQFSFGNDPPQVPIYKVAYFTPLTITSYDNYFQIYGIVDLRIPRVSTENTWLITYTQGNPMAKLTYSNISIPFNGPGNVVFSSGVNQKLDNSGFVTDGQIKEAGIFTLNCKLFRPYISWPITDTILVVVDPLTQVLDFSQKSKLVNIHGKMKVVNGDWAYFNFSGTLAGTNGLQGNNKPRILSFTVYGDIKADNQSISVNNIPTGFGGMNLTYDYANSQLTGSMSINMNFSAVALQGVAEVVFDAGGWYFILAGKMTTPGIGQINAGMMIGDYSSYPAAVQSTLMQFAYNKNIPDDFVNGVHGFFFTGAKDFPVQIPNISVDVPGFSITFGAEAGLDARLYMNFSDNGTTFGIGAMVFAHAWLSLAAVTCTSISADATAELLLAAQYNTSSHLFCGQACASISISGGISQGVPTFAGCEPLASISVGKSVHLDLKMDNSGLKDFSFGSGSCSTSGGPCN